MNAFSLADRAAVATADSINLLKKLQSVYHNPLYDNVSSVVTLPHWID